MICGIYAVNSGNNLTSPAIRQTNLDAFFNQPQFIFGGVAEASIALEKCERGDDAGAT